MVSFCARFLAHGLCKHLYRPRYFSVEIRPKHLKTEMDGDIFYVAFPDKPAYFKKISLANGICEGDTNRIVDASVYLDKSKYKVLLAFPDVESKQNKYLMSAVPSQSLIRELTGLIHGDGGCSICTKYRDLVKGVDVCRGVCVYFPNSLTEDGENGIVSDIKNIFIKHGLCSYSSLQHSDRHIFTRTLRLLNSDASYEETKYIYSRFPFRVLQPKENEMYESHLFNKQFDQLCPVFHSLQRSVSVLKQFSEEQESPEVSELLQIWDRYLPELHSVTDLTNMKHPFVVVEGLDATGKTTVTQILCEKLKGVRYYTPPEPIQHIRQYFDKLPEIIRRAYYTIGNYLVAIEITKECAHRPVVMDRFWHSTTAYGIANETSSGDLPCQGHWVYKWPTDLLQPDLVLFLSVSEEVRKQRIEQRREEKTFEEKSLDKDKLFRQRLHDAYRRMENPSCIEMDASGPLDTVVKQALGILDQHGIKCE